MPAADRPLPVVLDASVAVRWVVPERGSAEAAALLVQPYTWLAPRLLVTEVASALRRKAVAGELQTGHASQALAVVLDAIDDGVIRLIEDEQIIAAALGLAIMVGGKVPDCLYLALAEREGASLATADKILMRLARQRGVRTLLIPSA